MFLILCFDSINKFTITCNILYCIMQCCSVTIVSVSSHIQWIQTWYLPLICVYFSCWPDSPARRVLDGRAHTDVKEWSFIPFFPLPFHSLYIYMSLQRHTLWCKRCLIHSLIPFAHSSLNPDHSPHTGSSVSNDQIKRLLFTSNYSCFV